ncbi:glycoside hydrolase family 97 C-terminal domain-containing protein [Flavobacterium anhuiense]|nr:glycoside hydrolase family 97 C-terminal domain-containing protein [Flavobacterium anhuiense]
MKEVPTVWDEVRFLDGYPGRYVLLARRKGVKWYIAGINAENKLLKIKVKLEMLNSGATVNYYADDDQLNGKVSSLKMSKSKEVEIKIPKNGGIVITN